MNEVVHLIFSNQVVQHFSGIFPSVEWFDPRFNEPSGTGPHDSTNQTDPKLLVRFRVLVDRCCFFFHEIDSTSFYSSLLLFNRERSGNLEFNIVKSFDPPYHGQT